MSDSPAVKRVLADGEGVGWAGLTSPSRTWGGAGRGLRALQGRGLDGQGLRVPRGPGVGWAGLTGLSPGRLLGCASGCGAAGPVLAAPGSGGLAEGPVSHLGFPRTLGPSAAT